MREFIFKPHRAVTLLYKMTEPNEALHKTLSSASLQPPFVVPPRAAARHRLLFSVLSCPSAPPAVHFGEVGVSGSTSETKSKGGV